MYANEGVVVLLRKSLKGKFKEEERLCTQFSRTSTVCNRTSKRDTQRKSPGKTGTLCKSSIVEGQPETGVTLSSHSGDPSE